MIAIVLEVRDQQISQIYVLANPDKLKFLTRSRDSGLS
jgi:hypothetical protein